MAKHPNYPNPQLAEALCEIHFAIGKEHLWKPSTPGEIFKRLQADYPELEPITEQNVVLTIGPDGVPSQQLAPPRIRFKLTHGTKPFLVQLSEQIFTLNALAPYDGWSSFKTELELRWRVFEEIAKPESIKRIGLRYINRIRRESKEEKPEYWLRDSPYIATEALKSGAGFLNRVESRSGPNQRLMITLAHDQNQTPEAKYGALILDIDRIFEDKLKPAWKDWEPHLSKIHEEVWAVFDKVRGERLEKLVKQERKNV